jgi:hypothetical protein
LRIIIAVANAITIIAAAPMAIYVVVGVRWLVVELLQLVRKKQLQVRKSALMLCGSEGVGVITAGLIVGSFTKNEVPASLPK